MLTLTSSNGLARSGKVILSFIHFQRTIHWDLFITFGPEICRNTQSVMIFSSEQRLMSAFSAIRTENDLMGICPNLSTEEVRHFDSHVKYLNSEDRPVYYFVVYRRNQRKRYVSRRYNMEQAVERATMEIRRKNTAVIMARMASGIALNIGSPEFKHFQS